MAIPWPSPPCSRAVSAPMPEARYSEVACMASAVPGCCNAEATAVREAARPRGQGSEGKPSPLVGDVCWML